ncbi:MAG: hypothetical protein ACRDJL_02555, partial [Actinomycetota bacterium]
MEGPGDEALVPAGSVLEEGQAAPRPPGGKALLRLLELLERDGYSELAAQTVQLAVSEEDADRVMEIVAATGVVPTQDESAARPTAGDVENLGVAEGIAQAYLDAVDQMGPPTGVGPQWRSCGPWTVTNGQTYGATRINASGRISAMAVDPGNAAHVLAGAANGGVWESFNRGASW